MGEGREGGVFWGMFFCFGFFLGGEVFGCFFVGVVCVVFLGERYTFAVS